MVMYCITGKYDSFLYEWTSMLFLIVSLQFSHSIVSDSLQPHGLQHTPGLPVHHQHLEFAQTHVH